MRRPEALRGIRDKRPRLPAEEDELRWQRDLGLPKGDIEQPRNPKP